MSEKNDNADKEIGTTKEQIDNQLRGPLNQAQGLANSIKSGLPPSHTREVEKLELDLEVLERWTDDADDEGIEALAGAPVVVDTAQLRIDRLQSKVGQSDQGLATRLEEIEDTVEEIEDVVDALEITRTAYATYVNGWFADRYFDPEVQISTILIAGHQGEDIEEKVDDYGLFPQDGLYGESVEDLAFPANNDVNLSDEDRIYWTSTSDGGKIA